MLTVKWSGDVSCSDTPLNATGSHATFFSLLRFVKSKTHPTPALRRAAKPGRVTCISPVVNFKRCVMPCSVLLRFLALMTVAAAVLQSPASSARRRSLQSLRLGNVSCGCGKNMTQLVVKRTKVFDCTNVPYRGPRGLPSANEKGYPLRVRVRRSVDNSRMFINWNLKYIPKKKRAKVTDFYLHFTKPQKKSKTRTAQRGACFVVLPNGSKKCQRKVSCVANFSKRRPRRVSVNLLYRFAAKKSRNGGRRKRRGGQKYFRLKASARRKRSIKGYQGSSPRTRNPEISSCDEWSPSIKTECAGEGKLLVEFGPENPLAETIEVGLHEGISPRQMDTKYIQGNTSCTFENLQSGNYSVTLRPRSPNCYGVLPFRSEIIHVNVGENSGSQMSHANSDRGIPTCNDWHPSINVTCLGNKTLLVSFAPGNPLAEEFEIAVHEGISPRHKQTRYLPKNITKCTFGDLETGNYSVTLRPRSNACHGVLPWRSAVVEIKDIPCEDWHPRIDVSCPDRRSLHVSFDPVNPLAEEIEVDVFEDMRFWIQASRILPWENTSCTFENLASGNYSVMLSPRSKACAKALPVRSSSVVVIGDDIKSCDDWHPTINVSCSGNQALHVSFDPVNRWAEKIEVKVYEDIGPRITAFKILPMENTSYTFEDLASGNYSVTLRPRSYACHGVLPWRSAVVEVKDDIKSCDWHPTINVSCSGNQALHVSFDPVNPLAEEIEVEVYEDIRPEINASKILPRENTSYTFENLASGNYSVTLRPRSKACAMAPFVRSSIVVIGGEHLSPLCSDWTPNAKIREIGVDHSRIEVSYDVPNNLQANQIEVALEEDNKRVAHKIVDRRERNCTFDIVPKKDKTYLAMVRPRGCKDCADFTLHGDPCELSFHTSRVIRIGETRAVGLTVGKSRGSPFTHTDPNFTSEPTTYPPTGTTPTVTTGNATTTTVTTSTIPTRAPLGEWLTTLLVMLACSVLIVVVAALVVVGICKRSRKERHRSENGPEAIPLNCPTTPPDTDAPSLTQEDEMNSGPGADHHPVGAFAHFDHDTLVKERVAQTTLETIDETQTHQPNAAGDFAAQYEHANRTVQKRSLSPIESDKIVFLVHIREADNGLQDILGHFADVMQSLSSCRITVKLDFKCRKDNQKDVKGWAEGVLRSCTNVVVVLSESLVMVCQSYQRSMSLAANSTSAYTDIAPFVMRQLSGGMCSGLAVFVHFGMHNAEQQFESLLGLFSSPTSLSGSNGSDGFDNGEVTSSPPVLGPGDTVNFSSYSAVDLPIDVVADAEEAPSYHSVEPTGGRNSCPDQQAFRARCSSHHDAGHGKPSQIDVMRERHKSAPQKVNCRCLHPPAYPACSRLPVSSSSFSSSSYLTACPPLSSAVPSSVYYDALGACHHDPPPPYSECVAPGPPPHHQHVPHSLPVDTCKLLPHRQGSRAWTNGNKPQLLSLRGAKGLKEFLRILSQDERAIDSAVASEDAQSLFACIERRYSDLNPRGEPVEHTWAASPTQSTTSVCEKHSLQNLASADLDS
ncbi:uncharacterized protein [Littorina saxatilis]|uniref:uncharacterized protein isoform X3 n=1 Tax=Littorina saxatilis TaxID=31220 RepID=UPI0038B60CC9